MNEEHYMDRNKIVKALSQEVMARLTSDDLDQFVLAIEACFAQRKSRPERCDALIALAVLMSKLRIPLDVLDVKSRIETFLGHNFKYADRYRLAEPKAREGMRIPDIDLDKARELAVLAGFAIDHFRTKHGVSLC